MRFELTVQALWTYGTLGPKLEERAHDLSVSGGVVLSRIPSSSFEQESESILRNGEIGPYLDPTLTQVLGQAGTLQALVPVNMRTSYILSTMS